MIEEVYSFLAMGGPVMIPIALCSVIALAIFLERLWGLQRFRVVPRSLVERVRGLAAEGKFSEAKVLCEGSSSVIAKILGAAFHLRGRSREEIKTAMEDVGQRQAMVLERYQSVLSTVASISPLLGLLGTVTGMIKVFQRVTEMGVGDARVLANGIWEALLTTAAGLVVAIPTYIAFRYIQSRADRLMAQMEVEAGTLLDVMVERQEGAREGGA